MLHEVHDRRLKELLGQVIAAEVPAMIVDQATVEKWLPRLAGALLRVNQRHRVDARGRCRPCRPARLRARWWWPWWARSARTVQPTLAHYLRDAEPFLFPEDRGQS
ncbi:hypothetical protein [Streptosporangium sp. V21-05]|uniref:hypothetical protein n=1 Tax=Streptosporangium sp. V21-05 TaxID=3446115 RepID=UPI003F52A2E3